MITINGKEIVFQATMILHPEETAVVSTPPACGVSLKIKVGVNGVMPTSAEEMEKTVSGNEFTFGIPFLPANHSMAYDNDLIYAGKTTGLLIAAHGVGDWMVLHLQCHANR